MVGISSAREERAVFMYVRLASLCYDRHLLFKHANMDALAAASRSRLEGLKPFLNISLALAGSVRPALGNTAP
jgi:hypothetical protein